MKDRLCASDLTRLQTAAVVVLALHRRNLKGTTFEPAVLAT